MQIVPRDSWERLFKSQGVKNPLPHMQMLAALMKDGSSSREAKLVRKREAQASNQGSNP
jgi:hypothetical protein